MPKIELDFDLKGQALQKAEALSKSLEGVVRSEEKAAQFARPMQDTVKGVEQFRNAIKGVNTELERQKQLLESNQTAIRRQATEQVEALQRQKAVRQEMVRRLEGSGMTLDASGNMVAKPAGGARGGAGSRFAGLGSALTPLGLGAFSQLGGMSGAAMLGGTLAATYAGVQVAQNLTGVQAERAGIDSRWYALESQREAARQRSTVITGGIHANLQQRAMAQHYDPGHQMLESTLGRESALSQRRIELNRELATSRFASSVSAASAAATIANPLTPGVMGYTSTGFGAVQYGERVSRSESRDATIRAMRERDAAGSVFAEARGNYSEAAGRRDTARGNLRDAASQLEAVRSRESGVGINDRDKTAQATLRVEEAITRVQLRQVEMNEAQAAYELRRQQLKDASLTKEEKEVKLKQAGVGALQNEISILKNREALTVATSTRLGSMHPGQRMMGLSAAEFLKNPGNWNVATPDIHGAASAFDPVWYARMANEQGQKTPEYQRARDLGFDSFQGGDQKDIRNRIDELSAKAKDAMQGVDVAMAQSMANSVRGLITDLATDFNKRIDDLRNEFRAGQLLGTNRPGR